MIARTLKAFRGLLARHSAVFALVVACALPQPARCGPSDGSWTVLPPPSGRFGHAVAFDAAGDRAVMFGGVVDLAQNVFSNETFFIDVSGSGAWTPLAVSGTPPIARQWHSMVYDPVRNRMVIFGGRSADGTLLNDVWQLSLSGSLAWTQLAPTGTPPAPRSAHCAAYDPVNDRMIVFGGAGASNFNDVWALSLAGTPAWSLLSPSGAPPAGRRWASLVYDPDQQRLLLSCGLGAAYYADTWSFSMAGSPAWTLLSAPGTAPAARAFHSATYDPQRHEMRIFGGYNGSYFGDSYALSFAGAPAWSAIAPGGSAPAARMYHAAIHDPVHDRDIVFNGYNGSPLGDVWALEESGATPAWMLLPVSNIPSQHSLYTSMVRDAVHNRLILFNSGTSDVFVLPIASGQGWTRLVTNGTPPSSRQSASAIYDPVRDRLVVFGGFNAYTNSQNDTWILSLSGTPTWSYLNQLQPPAAREGHTAIYDAVRNRMVVFGGQDLYGTWFTDTWALSLGDNPSGQGWSLIGYGNGPSGRRDFAAAYDGTHHRMALYGGIPLNSETWMLDLTTDQWSPGPAGPSALAAATMAYDSARDRFLLYGGYDNSVEHSEVLALGTGPGAAWSALAPGGGSPQGREGSMSVYDPTNDCLLVYGGRSRSSVSTPFTDLLALQFSGVVGADAAVTAIALSPPVPNPARSAVDLSFTLPAAGPATLRVYDVEGRRVRSLFAGLAPAGRNRARWDRRTDAGSLVRPGLYFYELRAAGTKLSRRIVVAD